MPLILWPVTDFIFLDVKITADDDCSHEIKSRLLLGRKAMTNLDTKAITLPTKVYLVKAMVLPVVMYGCESWTVKKALESPLYSKDVKSVHPKGSQSWIFIGRTEDEAPVLWPPDSKSQLLGKDPDAGKDWGHEEKGATENEMVRWHHRLNGHEFEQTLGYSEGQRSLACCSPWGHSQTQLSDQTLLRIQWEYCIEHYIWEYSVKNETSCELIFSLRVGYHTNN